MGTSGSEKPAGQRETAVSAAAFCARRGAAIHAGPAQVMGLDVEVSPGLPLRMVASRSACSNLIDRPATTPDVWSLSQPAPYAASAAAASASPAPHAAPSLYVSFEDDSSAGRRAVTAAAGTRTPPPPPSSIRVAERPCSPDGAQGPSVPLSSPPEPPLPLLLAELPPSFAAAATAIVMGLGLTAPPAAAEAERGVPVAKVAMSANKPEPAVAAEAGGAERLGNVLCGSGQRHGKALPEPGPAVKTAVSVGNVLAV